MKSFLMLALIATEAFSQAKPVITPQKKPDLTLSHSEKAILTSNPQFGTCGEGMPEINLEARVPFPGASFRGPFEGIPHDNQDGLGTCYANTAKNLLVGLSNGSAVASFLDMALRYKADNQELESDGLDGGLSCNALQATREEGYCPQEFGVLERGWDNSAVLRMSSKSPALALQQNIGILRRYLSSAIRHQEAISEGHLSAVLVERVNQISLELQSSDTIQIPIPIFEHRLSDSPPFRSRFISLLEKNAGFSTEFEEKYDSFLSDLRQNLSGIRTSLEIGDMYRRRMQHLFQSVGEEPLLEDIVREHSQNSRLPQILRDSLSFKNEASMMATQSDEDQCGNEHQLEDFLMDFAPIVQQLSELGIDPADIGSPEAPDAEKLFQLTVAPSCINRANRREIPGAFSCAKISIVNSNSPETINTLTQKITAKLLEGLPVGNSYQTESGRGHINTIVGMRYNSKTRRCEVRIRESMTGNSEWENAGEIFQKMRDLTVVDRQSIPQKSSGK